MADDQRSGVLSISGVRKIQEILATIALQADDTLLTYEEALNIIDWSLDQTFAPQRPDSNIQILGLLESNGLTFTHPGCGMSAEYRRAGLSSFISRGIAVATACPSSQTHELAFAKGCLMGGCGAVSKYASALLKATRACPWSQLPYSQTFVVLLPEATLSSHFD